MKAVILAAGEGIRLRPLTLKTPKVLLPVNGVPLIAYSLTWLAWYGISEVAINLYHLGEKIKQFVKDGSQFGINATFSEEKRLLGTAGGVKRLDNFFDGSFVVFYGDNLTDFDLSAMVRFHQNKKALVTMAVFKPSEPSQVGMLELDAEGKIYSFIEKPQSPMTGDLSSTLKFKSSALANAAVYILEPEVLNYIKAGEKLDFAYNIFPKLIARGVPIFGYILEPGSYFIDIGTMKDYQRAIEDVKTGKVKVQLFGK